MNENQVESLLCEHGHAILASRTQPTRKKRAIGWKPILVAGVGTGAVLVFFFLPNTAEARWRKMQNAIKNASTMRMERAYRIKSGAWKTFQIEYVAGPNLRLDVAKGSGLNLTLISDGRTSVRTYKELPFSLRYGTESGDGGYYKEQVDPLKQELSYLDGDSDRTKYHYSTSSGQPVNGRNTYRIHYTRNGSNGLPWRTLDVVVDQATDLPIDSLCHDDPDPERGNSAQDLHTTFIYNQLIDPHVFDIDRSKHIIDVDQEKSILKKKWEGASVQKGPVPVLEASRASDGAIWVAFTMQDLGVLEPIPSFVVADKVRYRLSLTLPADSESSNRNWLIHGRQVVFAAFVPLYPPTTAPASATIQFAPRSPLDRSSGWAGIAPQVEFKDGLPELSIPLKEEQITYPSYLPILSFDKGTITLPAQHWQAIARGREEIGDELGAAAAFEEEAKAWKKVVKYRSMIALRDAAGCYDLIGKTQRATDLRKEADELDKSRER